MRRVCLSDEEGNGVGDLVHLCASLRSAARMPKLSMHTGAVPFRDIEMPQVTAVQLAGGRLVFRMERHVVDQCVPYGSDTAHLSWAPQEGFTLHWSAESFAEELHSVTAALCVDVVVTSGEGADACCYLIHTNPAPGSKAMLLEAEAQETRVGRMRQRIDGDSMAAFHGALKRLASEHKETLLHSFKLVHDAVLADDAASANAKLCVQRVAALAISEKRSVLCEWHAHSDRFSAVVPFLDAFTLADTAQRMIGERKQSVAVC